MRIGGLVLAFVIGKLAVEHLFADAQDVVRRVVEEAPLPGNACEALMEARPLLVRGAEVLERGMRDALGIVVHGCGDEVKVGIVRALAHR